MFFFLLHFSTHNKKSLYAPKTREKVVLAIRVMEKREYQMYDGKIS